MLMCLGHCSFPVFINFPETDVSISVTVPNWQRLRNWTPTFTLVIKWTLLTVQLDTTGLVWKLHCLNMLCTAHVSPVIT